MIAKVIGCTRNHQARGVLCAPARKFSSSPIPAPMNNSLTTFAPHEWEFPSPVTARRPVATPVPRNPIVSPGRSTQVNPSQPKSTLKKNSNSASSPVAALHRSAPVLGRCDGIPDQAPPHKAVSKSQGRQTRLAGHPSWERPFVLLAPFSTLSEIGLRPAVRPERRFPTRLVDNVFLKMPLARERLSDQIRVNPTIEKFPPSPSAPATLLSGAHGFFLLPLVIDKL
jgi:hypothetical protein